VGAKADATAMDFDLGGDLIEPDRAAVSQVARRAGLGFEHLERGHAARHVDEVLDLARDVEADVVTLQQAADDLPSPRQHVEDVGRGEIGVMEEGNLQVGTQFAQVGRHHPQVVVVNPDHGALGGFGRSALGEQAVDLHEHDPVFLAENRALPERVQRRPEGFLGEALVEGIDFVLGQGHACREQVGVAFAVDFGMGFERNAFLPVMNRPGDPRALASIEEGQQGRDDAVGRGRAAADGLAVLEYFLVGQAVIDHDQIGLAGRVHRADFGIDAAGAEEAEMSHGFENAATAGVVRMHDPGTVAGGVEQGRFGFADAHADEARFVHRQVVQGVAGDQDFVAVDAEVLNQGGQGAALVDAARQDVEVAIGRIQHLAAELGCDALDVRGDCVAVAEVGAAALLRDFLALEPVEVRHGLGHRAFARPARIDVRLQRLHRLTGVTIDDGAADVADDVVRHRDGGVGQNGKNDFQAAAGDKGKLDLRVGGNQLVQALTVLGMACEKGAIEIGCEQHVRFSLWVNADTDAD